MSIKLSVKHYEILILIHPDQSSQHIAAMLDRYLSIVSKGNGIVHRQEDCGKRKLAYQINKLNKANYVLLNIECNVNTITELKHEINKNDAIIRSLITKCKMAIKEPSALLKNSENEKSSANSYKDSSYSHNYNIPRVKNDSVGLDEVQG